MTFIHTIDNAAATGRLKRTYQRLGAPGVQLDNILVAHSLRPASLAGHMALYKSVLHHPELTLPKWFLEAVGVVVSAANGCEYCVAHHRAGLNRLFGDLDRVALVAAALASGEHESAFSTKECALLDYALRLTRAPAEIANDHIQALRAAGADDGEILEVNQVAAYFAYANRTVLGLGVDVEGEQLGLSPNSGDPDDWGHREVD